MKAKDIAAFLMQYPDADVVMDDGTTGYLYSLSITGKVWNDGQIMSLKWSDDPQEYVVSFDGDTLIAT